MLLGVISMFCFGILRISRGNRKMRKTRKSGQKNWAPTPQRREPTSLRRPTLRRGIPSLWRRSTPQRSTATLRPSYYSQRAKFWVLFQKSSSCTLIV